MDCASSCTADNHCLGQSIEVLPALQMAHCAGIHTCRWSRAQLSAELWAAFLSSLLPGAVLVCFRFMAWDLLLLQIKHPSSGQSKTRSHGVWKQKRFLKNSFKPQHLGCSGRMVVGKGLMSQEHACPRQPCAHVTAKQSSEHWPKAFHLDRGYNQMKEKRVWVSSCNPACFQSF